MEACRSIRANYTLNDLRIDTPESYMQLQNQLCISNPTDQCVLDSSSSPIPMPSANSTCRQGNVPSYYIEIEKADDVAAAFKFAEENDVELSVKNSGHDYVTRTSGKGTLSLWTHNIQGMVYHDDFTPIGSDKSVGPAMLVMAGVPVGDAYNFADKHDAIILGPYAPSVAMSTGWVTGGGHSVFSPVWGLGADRVVEFNIVTPDGVERIANEHQNADLFWALRGGGGGTFGVILSATHRVEPKVPIAYADIHLPSNATAEDSLKWVELLLEDSLAWGEAGWGGHGMFSLQYSS
jgi:FAD/FMN-containing dehydrogenase